MRRIGLLAGLAVASCLSVPAADEDGGSTGAAATSGTSSTSTTATTSTSATSSTSTTVGGTSTTATATTDETPGSTGKGTTGGDPFGLDDDPDLIAWYPFDEELREGGAADWSGNGLDALCNPGECPPLEPGVIGSAAHLDGFNDHFRSFHPQRFDSPLAWTVAVWIQRDAEDPEELRMPLGRAVGTGSRNTYEIYFHDWEGDGPVLLYLASTAGSGNDRISTARPPPIGEWMHVAGTWNGELLTLWVDGEAVASTPITQMDFDAHDLVIGADENSDVVTDFFNGSIDDLRIYGRDLTEEEIVFLAKG